jgi:hypothetical protein
MPNHLQLLETDLETFGLQQMNYQSFETLTEIGGEEHHQLTN